MMTLTKIAWVQFHKPVSLPGPGTARKWVANGRDGSYAGMVKHIVRDDAGYWMYISAGVNRGWYHMPFSAVEVASGQPPADVLDLVEPKKIEEPIEVATTGDAPKAQRKRKTTEA